MIPFEVFVCHRINDENVYKAVCPVSPSAIPCTKDRKANCYICPTAEKAYEEFKEYCRERGFKT